MATLTLNLDERHDAVLTALAAEQELSKTALLRQALRLYQVVHDRHKQGKTMAWRNADGTYVQQVVVGLPAFDDATPAPQDTKESDHG